MPVLANPKHEVFAQELAKGRTLEDAYVAAGYSKSRSNASALRTKYNILERVLELQGAGVERTEVTIEGLIREADELQRLAKASGMYAASITALTAKAKLAGLWIERSDNVNHYKRDATDWSRDELVTIINDALAGGEGTAPPQGRGEQPDPLH